MISGLMLIIRTSILRAGAPRQDIPWSLLSVCTPCPQGTGLFTILSISDNPPGLQSPQGAWMPIPLPNTQDFLLH